MSRRPYRDIAREETAVEHSRAALDEFEAAMSSGAALMWPEWAGRLAARVEDLLKTVKILQAVADHAEGER